MSHSDHITMLAPAKVNLFLHITGRRNNGYHELESLFVRTDFGDRVVVENADTLSLEITGTYAQELRAYSIDSNLVMKAARLMLSHHGERAGAKIILDKQLPVSSGIGGGSADAAATLLALKALWKVSISDNELNAMALELGADVPACLHDRPQWVTGVGENCQAVSLGFDAAILLVNPQVAVSTPDVFKVYKESNCDFSPPQGISQDVLRSVDVLDEVTENDLFDAARTMSPAIDDVIEMLASMPNQQMVRMSGSGATCYALFQTLSDANKAQKIIKANKPEWWLAYGSVIR